MFLPFGGGGGGFEAAARPPNQISRWRLRLLKV